MSVKVIAIRFREAGKVFHFSPNGFTLHIGDAVIVETSEGMDFGYVTEEMMEVPEDIIAEPLRNVMRMAREEDFSRYEEKLVVEKEAFRVCNEKIRQHRLDMNLVETESSFDSKKLIFYFTADGRIDFRELVKDLAAIFRSRIELRQIGVRDQARMVGGFGLCGRELCCCSFLFDFAPVSIKMAKTQGLSMNPNKISGACGRLMCCLKFEQEAYEDAHSRLPDQGDIVSSPEGKGVIQSVDYLKETARVLLEKEDAPDIQVFPCASLEVLVPKKKKKAQARASGGGGHCAHGKGKKDGCPKMQQAKKNQPSAITSGDPYSYEYKVVDEKNYSGEEDDMPIINIDE